MNAATLRAAGAYHTCLQLAPHFPLSYSRFPFPWHPTAGPIALPTYTEEEKMGRRSPSSDSSSSSNVALVAAAGALAAISSVGLLLLLTSRDTRDRGSGAPRFHDSKEFYIPNRCVQRTAQPPTAQRRYGRSCERFGSVLFLYLV